MFIIGKKLNMSQTWNDNNKVVPITKLKCTPSKLVNFKTEEKDGYRAAMINCEGTIKEFKLSPKVKNDLKQGIEITVDSFAPGDRVKITGRSKGKGFQGVVKRHGFKGGGASHGHRHDLRQGGSIGSAYPQHVMKGKKMAGRMGNDKISINKVLVVKIDKQKNILMVRGAIPGRRGSLVFISKQ